MWGLDYKIEGNDESLWKHISDYPSGDTAKTHARQHQIGKIFSYTYQITDPNGKEWMIGRSKFVKKGFKMVWTWI